MNKHNRHCLLVLQSAENNFITFSLHLLYLPFQFKNFTEEMLKHSFFVFLGGLGVNISPETTKDPLIITCPSTKSETLGLNFKILKVNHNYKETRLASILLLLFSSLGFICR